MAPLMGRFYVILSKGLFDRTCFIWHCNDFFQNDQQNLKKGYPQWLIVEIHFIPQFVQGNLFNMNNEITLGTEMHFFKFFIADKNNEDLSEKGFLSRRKKKSLPGLKNLKTQNQLCIHICGVFSKNIQINNDHQMEKMEVTDYRMLTCSACQQKY